ncbi:MAG: hypothetical protein D6714_02740 [Bacteroidetes bacterium]|nr:MAG: hypothetical protein D6714_02740 [Bacteroidota bacterium]
MPNYVGSVRTMLVASNSKGIYGNAEKTTPVKKPLMVLATLPRVLSPTESLRVPVTVFAMDKKVKDVRVTLEAPAGLIKMEGPKTQNLHFEKPGEEMVWFDIAVAEKTGIARFKINAQSGNETASQEIELDVRNPNPYVTDVVNHTLSGGESWNTTLQPVGMAGTNQAILEVSNIPPINLGERLQYLLRYPHGCIEQTVSSAFPQLYVGQLLELTEDQKKSIPIAVDATINRLKNFQLASGGFSYWPSGDLSPWGTNYGGHFLLEAKNAGYYVPDYLLNKWIKFQQKRARQWDPEMGESGYYSMGRGRYLMQSYRLYTLALAGNPELGAMNRLREMPKLPVEAKWQLAAAYALAGKTEIAQKMTEGVSTEIEPYSDLGYTYGTALRDQAIILETALILDDKDLSARLVRLISKELSKNEWLSTQTIAWCLRSVAQFAQKHHLGGDLQFSFAYGGKSPVNAGSKHPVFQVQIPVDELQNRAVSVKNPGQSTLFVRIISTGQPLLGDQTGTAQNLELKVSFLTATGAELNPERIEQGTDFFAVVSVVNPGKLSRYDEMALTQVFPSGWEILNTRVNDFGNLKNASVPEYQDVRDDRVYMYFDIDRNARQVFRVRLNAAYEGRYYLPTTTCEAMYDNTISARVPGRWVEVVQPGTL